MGKKFEGASVRCPISPNRDEARQLLHEIASKPPAFGPRKVNKPLVLYGAGSLGMMAKEFLNRVNIPFMYVVDANPERYAGGKTWAGISIIRSQETAQEHRATCMIAVCVCTVPFNSIAAQLAKEGWKDVVPFYDVAEAYQDQYPLSNGWFAGALTKQDMEGLEYALAQWDDDVSRAHHLQFLVWHYLRDEWSFDDATVTVNDRYFIPKVTSIMHDHEVLVDGGAHHGEVISRFMEIVKNRYAGIYAIEPDMESLVVLRGWLNGKLASGGLNIHLLECALGAVSKKGQFYHGLGYTSQFSKLGQEEVPVRALDDLSIPATFIKLHIEGWEPAAISGGMRTIVSNRPILTVTAYHKRNGLWELPTQIMTSLDDYNFLFRLHSYHGTGGVIYAIPKERIAFE